MTDDFSCGVMVALGFIYDADQETLAGEIVSAIGASELLKVAKANDDIFLPNLRKTVNSLRRSAR